MVADEGAVVEDFGERAAAGGRRRHRGDGQRLRPAREVFRFVIGSDVEHVQETDPVEADNAVGAPERDEERRVILFGGVEDRPFGSPQVGLLVGRDRSVVTVGDDVTVIGVGEIGFPEQVGLPTRGVVDRADVQRDGGWNDLRVGRIVVRDGDDQGRGAELVGRLGEHELSIVVDHGVLDE